MKIESRKFAIACFIAASVVWVICSVAVMIMPMSSMQMTGHMVHGDFSNQQWAMDSHGFLFGWVGWALSAGLIGWMIAALYNRLIR